jgi:hypothetical protein
LAHSAASGSSSATKNYARRRILSWVSADAAKLPNDLSAQFRLIGGTTLPLVFAYNYESAHKFLGNRQKRAGLTAVRVVQLER